VDTELFFDRFSKGQFAQYLLLRHENPPTVVTEDMAKARSDQATLFIEATHAAEQRVNGVIVG